MCSARPSDPWGSAVIEWMKDDKPAFVTTKDVWLFALKGAESALDNLKQKRIANVLKDLGYIKKTSRRDGKLVRGFFHEGYAAQEKEGDLFS